MGLIYLFVCGDRGACYRPAVLTTPLFLKAGLHWSPLSEKHVGVYVTLFSLSAPALTFCSLGDWKNFSKIPAFLGLLSRQV